MKNFQSGIDTNNISKYDERCNKTGTSTKNTNIQFDINC